MIPKGNQRGGGRQLATHLLNQFDNDHVEVADLRGAVAQDLHGAFHEWFAQSKATKCQKYLYSLSVNPDLAKYDLTREQYLDFVARTERSLKLIGQPRAVVFHVKNGRQHCHAVWSRIDPDAGKRSNPDYKGRYLLIHEPTFEALEEKLRREHKGTDVSDLTNALYQKWLGE